MWIGNRKELLKLTSGALTLNLSERRVNSWEVRFRIYLRWLIYTINLADETKV